MTLTKDFDVLINEPVAVTLLLLYRVSAKIYTH